ncbi:signal peptidase II [Cohnella hongkongensis]|uniref:Lipoprotein signal peptidase n=1 Tax=Cohnella hongkongensis TaxID=178337 RepID=A0ABV9F5N6_9BACL
MNGRRCEPLSAPVDGSRLGRDRTPPFPAARLTGSVPSGQLATAAAPALRAMPGYDTITNELPALSFACDPTACRFHEFAREGVDGVLRYGLTAFGVIALDHLVKWLVVTYMTIGQQITVIPGVIGLASIRNRGAAFGMLQGQRGFFILITTAVLIGILLYMRKTYREKKILSYGLAIIWGGAFGNFIDRVVTGEVVDMFQFYFIDFPIFNVADTCLWIGIGFVMLDAWKESRAQRASETSHET